MSDRFHDSEIDENINKERKNTSKKELNRDNHKYGDQKQNISHKGTHSQSNNLSNPITTNNIKCCNEKKKRNLERNLNTNDTITDVPLFANSARNNFSGKNNLKFHKNEIFLKLDENSPTLSEKSLLSPIIDNNDYSNRQKESKTQTLHSFIKQEVIEDKSFENSHLDIKENEKKCSACKRILPINNFSKLSRYQLRKDSSHQHRCECNDCRSSINAARNTINHFSLKLKSIKELFGEKCCDCGIGFEVLPAFDFDHIDPNKKENCWSDYKMRSIKDIKIWKENEDLTVRCYNCHSKRHASIFNRYKSIIMNKGLFLMKPEDIENYLDENIKRILGEEINGNSGRNLDQVSNNTILIKSNIKEWIRKRYIIETLYEGKCCGCGLDVQNLPAFQFHHIDPRLKDKMIVWDELSTNNESIKILLDEECIGICGNCHRLKISNYLMFWDRICENAGLSFEECQKNRLLSHERLKNIEKYINNYKINLPILKEKYDKQIIKMPLKFDYEWGENYKKVFIQIYHYVTMRENMFSKNLLKDSFGVDNFYEFDFKKLINMKYIAVDDDNSIQKIYHITDLGFKIIEEYRLQNQDGFDRLKEKVTNPEFKYDSSKKIKGEMNKKRIYSNVLFKVIYNNGFNEFSFSDISQSLNFGINNTSAIVNRYLLPNGLVENITNPVYFEPYGNEKVFRLTQNSIENALKESNNVGKIINFDVPKIDLIKNKQLIILLKLYCDFSESSFFIREFNQKYFPEIEFQNFKTFFYTRISNPHYVQKIGVNEYKLSDTGKKYVEHFLKFNQIKQFE